MQRIVRARKIVVDLSLFKLKPGELEEVLMTLLMVILYGSLYHFPWSSNTSSVAAAVASSLNLRRLSDILHAIIDLRTIMHHFNPMERLIQLNFLEHMQVLLHVVSMHLVDLKKAGCQVEFPSFPADV